MKYVFFRFGFHMQIKLIRFDGCDEFKKKVKLWRSFGQKAWRVTSSSCYPLEQSAVGTCDPHHSYPGCFRVNGHSGSPRIINTQHTTTAPRLLDRTTVCCSDDPLPHRRERGAQQWHAGVCARQRESTAGDCCGFTS